jgi:hypothetical protein
VRKDLLESHLEDADRRLRERPLTVELDLARCSHDSRLEDGRGEF